MKYFIKSGKLMTLEDGIIIAQIKNIFGSSQKLISSSENKENKENKSENKSEYQTQIIRKNATSRANGDVRNQTYILKNETGTVFMEAHPAYSKDEDPDVFGWPVCHTPKVDHADITLHNHSYLLIMHNSQNYSLQNTNNTTVLQIMHNGISGGWTIDTSEAFPPQILCGLFLFCRYIEQENEFIVI